MIKELYPNLKDKPRVINKYELYVSIVNEKSSVSVDMHVDHDIAIEILNRFSNNELLSYMNLSQYNSHYHVEYGHYQIKDIKLISYYDYYGRECTVNVDQKFDYNKRALIYSSTGKKVFDCEYSSSVYCDFFVYAKSEDIDNHIEFKINSNDIDRYFFLYIYDNYKFHYEKSKTLTFRINKETLVLTCVEKPDLLIDMKVKNT